MYAARWISPLFIILALAGSWFVFNAADGKGRHGHGHGGRHREETPVATPALSEAEAKQARALYAKTCSGCHGAKLEGAVGPALVGVASRYSLEKIARIAQYGKGRKKSVSMPSGLATSDEAALLARWLDTNPTITGAPATEPASE